MIRTLIAVLLTFVATSTATAGSCATLDRRIENRAIVRVRPGASLEAFIAAFTADHPDIPVALLDTIPARPIHLVALDLPPDITDNELDQLEEELETGYPGQLDWGEFLYENETPEGGSGSTFLDGPANASLYATQYAAEQTRLPDAHKLSTGLGVVVAVVDTGVDVDHAALAGTIVSGGYDFVDDDTLPLDVGNGLDDDNDGLTDEMAGHGTFVAGLVSLAAPGTGILPVRVLDSEGRGDMWLLAEGIFHAVDQGVEVINLSIGSTYNSDAVGDALEEAELRGIVTVAAAGNCNREDPEEYPAMRSSHVVGVAAVDDGDIKGDFSNYSEELILSAPGVMFLDGAVPDADRSMIGPVPGGGFAHWEGTSMATPLVSGAFALLRAQRPDLPATEQTYDLLIQRLTSTAEDIDAENPALAGTLGAGRIDVGAAVAIDGPAPALGDLDGSGAVGVDDLLILLGDWGETFSSADLDGSGVVAVEDLLLMLGGWG